MALFKRPRKAPAPAQAAAAQSTGPPVDPLAGDAVAHRFRAELAEGRWQEFHDFLAADRDWTSRDFYVSKLSDITGRPGWLEEWIQARPGSSLPSARQVGRKAISESAGQLMSQMIVTTPQLVPAVQGRMPRLPLWSGTG